MLRWRLAHGWCMFPALMPWDLAAWQSRPTKRKRRPSVRFPVLYVLTKRAAEQVLLEQRGLDVVIVNPAFMLGPWDWKPSSGRMLLEVSKGLVAIGAARRQ